MGSQHPLPHAPLPDQAANLVIMIINHDPFHFGKCWTSESGFSHLHLLQILPVPQVPQLIPEDKNVCATKMLPGKISIYLSIYLPSGILASTAQSTVISSSLSNLEKVKLTFCLNKKYQCIFHVKKKKDIPSQDHFNVHARPQRFFVIGCICRYIDGLCQLSR